VILVIDNYDSFTFNLVQILLKNRFAVKVIKNDEWSIEDICKNQQLIEAFLFSPGPGHPKQAQLCLEILKEFASTHPILGVCLGHQVIAEYFGAKVVRAARPMHGKVSVVEYRSKGSFRGLPMFPVGNAATMKVVRYHSLIVDETTLPECLEVTARTTSEHATSVCTWYSTPGTFTDGAEQSRDSQLQRPLPGEVMALRHKTFAIEGWQFHPESILTDHGEQLVVNFFRLS
jgi:para-aminobenzoate synthetase component II